MTNMETRHAYRTCLLVWAALMVLLLLTFGSAYLKLGIWNSIANFVIAAAKAALVAIFFMHLGGAPSLLRIAAVSALLVLSLLFGLSHADYATREMRHAPWQAPLPFQKAGG